MSNLNTTSSKLSATSKRANRTAGMLKATICGMPCLIDVLTCEVVKGSFRYDAASDLDYSGYKTIEFDVYDRKGYRAAWLEAKMTDDDRVEIEEKILKANTGYDN